MNKLRDHGRGYTWTSMRMTERRCRRRIGTSWTSRSSDRSFSSRTAISASPRLPLAVPRLPVDLGVGLAQVERLELPRGHELLPQGPRVGELHQGGGRWIGVAEIAELRARRLGEHRRVAQGAVAEHQALLSGRP